MNCRKHIALVIVLCSRLTASNYQETLKTFLQAKEPINISNIVVDLSTQQPCIIDKWDEITKYACRCALVKEAEEIAADMRDGATIIQNAKEQGFCTDELLNQLRKDEGLEELSDTAFINELYYRSKVIKNVKLPSDSELYKTGNLTEKELKKILVQAYKEKKLLNPAFAAAKCIGAKNISSEGGYQTGWLFIVQNLCGKPDEFIVKEVKKQKHEIFDLSLASHAQELKPYIYPQYEPGFPILVLPISYLHVSTPTKSHYLSIMPKAPGVELVKLVLAYFKSPNTHDKEILIKAYSSVGTTLANFHKKFMRKISGKDANGKKLLIPSVDSLSGRTITHGDLHGRNMFYDPKTDLVYWIDNEHVGEAALDPKSIKSDLSYVIYTTNNLFLKQIEDKAELVQICFKPFLQNYLAAFGGNRLQHAEEMKAMFSKDTNALTPDILNVIQEIIDSLQEPDESTFAKTSK